MLHNLLAIVAVPFETATEKFNFKNTHNYDFRIGKSLVQFLLLIKNRLQRCNVGKSHVFMSVQPYLLVKTSQTVRKMGWIVLPKKDRLKTYQRTFEVKMWPLEIGPLQISQVKLRSLGWVLIQHDWCPYQMTTFRHRDRHAQKEDNGKDTERMPCEGWGGDWIYPAAN